MTGAPGTSSDGGRAARAGAPAPTAYAVGDVAAYLQELLDTDPLVSDLWIAGELTDLSRSQAGHLYFTLSDSRGALRCAFFRRENLGVQVETGDQVLVHGRISIYLERGDLRLYVDALQPQGVGVFHAEFQRLQERLRAEGLFEPARKQPPPRYPRVVGVVTSPSGAVWHDIQTVAARRWPLAALVLAPARVQGDGAAESIVGSIEDLNALAARGDAPIDVIIVARGGGSLEDLWAFNEEAVARAIFASRLPVVSAVGHETDVTIADLVADVRAPTPSAAAEIVFPDQARERAALGEARAALGRGLERAAAAAQQRLNAMTARLDRAAPDLDQERLRLDDLLRRAEVVAGRGLAAGRTVLARIQGRLSTLNPAATLARGYAIVENAAGEPVVSVRGLAPGDMVRLRLQDGTAGAAIQSVDTSEP